jgi:hypothetical protein
VNPQFSYHKSGALPNPLVPLANICNTYTIFLWQQSDQKFEKNRPIFGNVAKTVAKLQKLKLKVKNSCSKLLLNVKISTTSCVLKLFTWIKF